MLKTASRKLVCAFVVATALSAPGLAFAGEWVVESNPVGPGYVVTDHETAGVVHTQGKKAADKVAKALNDAEATKDKDK